MNKLDQCSFCLLVDSLKPGEITIGDIAAIARHLKVEHGWIAESEFQKWT